MMKDITWGQYHSVDSMIHRIDPRVKIRFTIIIYYPAVAGSESAVVSVSYDSICRCVGVQPGADAQDDTRNEGRVHFHLNLQYIKCIYHAWNDVGKAWRAHDHEGGTDQSRIRVLADVVVDSDVKPVDVYDDTDETDGRYGEVHAFKRRCGNGNHDRATICTDIIWRVRPDHEGADGAWRGLQEGKSGRAF